MQKLNSEERLSLINNTVSEISVLNNFELPLKDENELQAFETYISFPENYEKVVSFYLVISV